METTEATKIIRLLSDGINPLTGEIFPEDSPYQNSQIIRALFKAADALEKIENRERKKLSLPSNAGSAWTELEDNELINNFNMGKSFTLIASEHQRTIGAIKSRLVKLGLVKENDI